MASRNMIAIDLGAESGRVMLAQFDGQRLSLDQTHRFPNKPVRTPAHMHWNVLALWDEIMIGLGRAAEHGHIASIGIDTWAVDFALLDASGDMLANPVCYRDPRTDGMMGMAFQRVSREQIFDATGIQFMPINTLYQLMAMAEGKSPVLDVARSLLMMPDVFNYWLTGVLACEFTNATSTQMFDPRRHDWARDVLSGLGLPHHFLLSVTEPGSVLGTVSTQVQRLIGSRGLTHARVIAPATHDTASAVAGTPLTSARSAYISSGTWSLLGAVARQPVMTPEALKFNFTNEGGLNGTFRLLKNISGMWLVQECRRAWQEHGHALPDYAALFADAERSSPFLALVDPDDPSFAHPDDMPAAICAFCVATRQPPPETPGQFARLILESLALKYRQVLGQLESLLGSEVDVIHIVGGGSQNALLCQFAADACNRPVAAGPVEATAIGNVLVQLVADGALSLADAGEVVRTSFGVQHYAPRDTGLWDEAYNRWQILQSRPERAR